MTVDECTTDLVGTRPWVVTLTGPRRVEVLPAPPAPLPPGHVRVRTLFSGISAGTELTQFRGTTPHAQRRWLPDERVFVDQPSSGFYPNTVWGYSEVGEVVELGAGVDAGTVAPGSVVWGMWGHRGEAVLPAEVVARRVLPPSVDPLWGTFVRVGAVALGAVLAADLHVGETAAVFGQGVIGLLATQLAVANGARVVAVDGIAVRRAHAAACGAQVCLDPAAEDVGRVCRALTGDRGADACVELSGSYAALHEAVRSTAPGGRVVAAGFYQGDGLGLRLGEEFHHNRVQLVSSQISAVPPWMANRWTPERLHATVVDLIAECRLDVRRLVGDVVPVRRAAQAYALLDADPAGALQVVLDFRAGAS
jgi:2-desacetyl-2-hydroxyethyl bacteriochlorophyllide A dehydrogenase